MINCTPHPITVRLPSGDVTFEPSGTLPRVSTVETPADPIDGIPCATTSTGAVTGLPEPFAQCSGCKALIHPGPEFCSDCGGRIETQYIIVSRMVFDATDRRDVVCPDTGPTCVRDEKGRILAVTRLLVKA